MNDANDKALREHLVYLLGDGGAHARFDQVVTGISTELRGSKPEGLPHSPWMLLEHIRIAQWDILEFSRNPKYKQPEWPAAYWPKSEAPPSDAAWKKSIEKCHQDLKAMQQLVKNPASNLFARIPWGEGQTILREAMLVADHNAYHLAQLVDVRRLLGAWQEG